MREREREREIEIDDNNHCENIKEFMLLFFWLHEVIIIILILIIARFIGFLGFKPRRKREKVIN